MKERYHSLAPMYYRGAEAAVVVFDITSPDSFTKAKVSRVSTLFERRKEDRLQEWVNELQRQASPGIVIALAGNKVGILPSVISDERR